MGPNTPVIVVVTKRDGDPTRHIIGELDTEKLRFTLAKRPDVIQDFSATLRLPPNGRSQPTPVVAIRNAIANALQNVKGIYDKISPDVSRMKRRVERELENRSLVSICEYEKWCKEENVDDPNQSILRILHDFGCACFFGLTDDERRRREHDKPWLAELPPGQRRFYTATRDSSLDNWIANPNWLKWPMYEIIRQSADSQRNPNGIMSFDEIKEFAVKGTTDKGLNMPLPEGATYVTKVLELTGLCWGLEGRYFFPHGLPDKKPYGWDAWTTIAWWEWGFLPEYALHRFTVQMHERNEVVRDSDGVWQHWRKAVVVEYPSGCRAAVTIAPAIGRVEVRLDPSSSDPASFGELCELVGTKFEKEIVNRRADLDWIAEPAEIVGENLASRDSSGDLQYARQTDLIGGVKRFAREREKKKDFIPAPGSVSKWCKKLKRRGDKLHIDGFVSRYEEFVIMHLISSLTDDDKYCIKSHILSLAAERQAKDLQSDVNS